MTTEDKHVQLHIFMILLPSPLSQPPASWVFWLEYNYHVVIEEARAQGASTDSKEKVSLLAPFYPCGKLRDRPWIKSPPLNSNKKETSKAVGRRGSALALPKGFTKDLPTFGNSASSSFYSATRALAELQNPAHPGYFDNTKDFTELVGTAYLSK